MPAVDFIDFYLHIIFLVHLILYKKQVKLLSQQQDKQRG